MKLSKSQRLFIKIGEFNFMIGELKRMYRLDKLERIDKTRAYYAKNIKNFKKRREKLLREAVRAADEELDKAWHEGLSVGVDWTI